MAMHAIERREEGRELEPLDSKRSFQNECTGRDMAGCIENREGHVVCYFPSREKFEKYAELFCRMVDNS